jgi:hypothetical protein
MDITSDDRLGEDEWRRFETQLLSAIGRNVPKWTDRQDGDPGVAIVELFAFLAEQLIYRAGTIPDRSRARLFEVADKLESLPGTVDVRAATVCIEGDQWQQTASLANAGPDDHFFISTDEGRIAFGDGQHGQQPAMGSNVFVSYRMGGGANGNTRVSVTSRWPLTRSRYSVKMDPQLGISVVAVADTVE